MCACGANDRQPGPLPRREGQGGSCSSTETAGRRGKTPLVPPWEGGDAEAGVVPTIDNQVLSLEGRDREGLAAARVGVAPVQWTVYSLALSRTIPDHGTTNRPARIPDPDCGSRREQPVRWRPMNAPTTGVCAARTRGSRPSVRSWHRPRAGSHGPRPLWLRRRHGGRAACCCRRDPHHLDQGTRTHRSPLSAPVGSASQWARLAIATSILDGHYRQRDVRELLHDAGVRALVASALADARGGPSRPVRVHRRLLHPVPPALGARLPFADPQRTDAASLPGARIAVSTKPG